MVTNFNHREGAAVSSQFLARKMKKLLFATICAIAVFFSIDSGAAFAMNGWGGPFGGYCRGPAWGWYGARRAVKSAEEARRIVLEYYSGDGIKIGDIRDRRLFYEIEINDKDGVLVDVVIVDKRTGRIRSID